MAKDKLTDPADAGKANREEVAAKEGQEQVSFDRLKLSDFKAVPKRAARTPHPFQGYPEKKVKAGTYKEKGKEVDLIINATHLVALIPGTHDVPQDPSNEGIRNTQNVIVSYAGRSVNIVFDREMELEDGQKVLYALIPDPLYRSQVVFGWDPKTEQIIVHDQYLLLDDGQFSRLRQVFQMVLNPKLKVERVSKAISGESAESLDELKSVSDEVSDGSS
jgi:hypothetical protein